jgi:arginine decarboxylase-like protein
MDANEREVQEVRASRGHAVRDLGGRVSEADKPAGHWDSSAGRRSKWTLQELYLAMRLAKLALRESRWQ